MAFTQLLPIQNRTGTITSPVAAVPANSTMVDLRIDLDSPGTANEFTSVDQGIELSVQWSFDNQATWTDPAQSRLLGSATRTWGKLTLPYFGQGIPQSPYPTHARASLRLVQRNTTPPPEFVDGGTVRFGVSIQVT